MTGPVWPRRLAATQEARIAERLRDVERNAARTSRNVSVANPSVGARHNAAIACANATWTITTLNTDIWNNGWRRPTGAVMHDPTGGGFSGLLTIPIPGIYAMEANAEFANNVTGIRSLAITKGAASPPPGGGTVLAEEQVPASAGTATTILNIYAQDKLVEGDIVTMYFFQTSGGALNVLSSGTYSPRFTCTWIGPG